MLRHYCSSCPPPRAKRRSSAIMGRRWERAIDLNCDLGEGYGRWTVGSDGELMRSVSSANIACGFHAGDPSVIRATVELAQRHGVAVGVHPGYPDLQGFGRRAMVLAPDEVEAIVLYQIGAVYAFARAAGVDIAHCKPHGALYNQAWADQATAWAIARSVHAFSPDLILVGQAGSALVAAGEELGHPVAREAFADRAYEPDGTLRARRLPGSVLSDPFMVANQAVRIARDGVVEFGSGTIGLDVDTICLHGDSADAPRLAHAIRDALDAAGVSVHPLRAVLARRPQTRPHHGT